MLEITVLTLGLPRGNFCLLRLDFLPHRQSLGTLHQEWRAPCLLLALPPSFPLVSSRYASHLRCHGGGLAGLEDAASAKESSAVGS